MRRAPFALVLLTAVGLAACGKAAPKMPGPVVALAMPAPPERVLVPVELPEPDAEPVPARPAPAPSAPARNTAPRPSTGGTAPSSPSATSEPTAPPPPQTLQTTANVTAVEQRTRGLIAAAERDLGRLQPAGLGASARAQYDQARGFIKMALDALRIRNFMYAEQLASKAASVAAQLVK